MKYPLFLFLRSRVQQLQKSVTIINVDVTFTTHTGRGLYFRIWCQGL